MTGVVAASGVGEGGGGRGGGREEGVNERNTDDYLITV